MLLKKYLENMGITPREPKGLIQKLLRARDLEGREIEWKVIPTDDSIIYEVKREDAVDVISSILDSDNGVAITRTSIIYWSMEDKYVRIVMKE